MKKGRYPPLEIYFDNSATTRVSNSSAQRALELMQEEFGNPSSLHRKGFLAEQALAAAREDLAAILGPGVRREEIWFTSCGSEGNNLAVLGAARAAQKRGNKVVTTAVEHESVLAPVKHLSENGFETVLLPPTPQGNVDPQSVEEAVDQRTVLLSVMLVNSETGAVNDLLSIAQAARRKNPKVVIHCDCVQGFGKLLVLPGLWGPPGQGVDVVTISGHKIHAPKGIGALYVKKGTRLRPLYYGSGQEGGFHPGTENTPGACAMALAAREMWEHREENMAHFRALRERLLNQIKKISGACINSPAESAPYIVNLSLPGIRSEVMIHYLERQGISVSSGSACSKGAKSHVLTAMGLDPSRVDSAIRVSFCRDNTLEEVDEFCRWLQKGAGELARVRR